MRHSTAALQPPRSAGSTSTQVPSSPAARRLSPPRWLDARLLLGIVLVLGSVAAGTRLVASLGDTQMVWAVTADLAAGTRLTGEHLDRVEVRLTGELPARYLDASGRPPVGYVLTRPLASGELVPAAAVAAPNEAGEERRYVTVPVQQHHFPGDLRAGEVVDVYVTVARDDAEPVAALVGASVTVAAIHGDGRGGFGGVSSGVTGIELSVPAADAPVLVEALQTGPVDVVRVLSGTGG